MARIDGREVLIGDLVNFKSDFEQCGTVTKIEGQMLTIKSFNDNGFGGDYIGGQEYVNVVASKCWFE